MLKLQLYITLILFSTIVSGSNCCADIATGVVRNSVTHQPIQDANIEVIGKGFGAATNENGEFKVLGLTPGTYSFRASALGYNATTISEVNLKPGRALTLEFLMEPVILSGKNVVVRKSFFVYNPDLVVSRRSLSFEEIRRAPGSAEDVQRAIQALPGIANSNDQTNEIIVRGGSPSENLLILDGLEIDNMNHFPDQSTSGGPISMINPEFLKEVTFASGGFSAKYGDRLSSVLDLQLREGRRDKIGGQIEMSMAGAGADIEGGFINGKGSYLASFRQSYLDLIQNAVGLTAVPVFWDFQTKIVYDHTPLDKISIYSFYGEDRISFESDKEDAWSRGAEGVDVKGHTFALGSRYRKIHSKGFTEMVLGTVETKYDQQAFEIVVNERDNKRDRRLVFSNQSIERLNQFKLTWNREHKLVNKLSLGFSLKPIQFDHNRWLEMDTTVYDDFTNDGIQDTVYRDEMDISEQTTALKYGAFTQYSWRHSNSLTTVFGLRMDKFEFSNAMNLDPRFSLRWDINEYLTFRIGGGKYHQTHPLIIYTSDPDGSNRSLPNPSAFQFITGFDVMLTHATILSIETYLKKYDNLLVSEQELKEEEYPEFRSWRWLSVGKKSAGGIEFFLQQKLVNNWYGTLSYSYGKSEFDNSVMKYPSSYDFRHIATMVFGYKFSGKAVTRFQQHWYGYWTYALPLNGDELTASTRLRFVSGRPYTSKVWTVDGSEYDYHWEKSKYPNNTRYPEYLRWDLRWDSRWYKGSSGIVTFLEIQNVLNRGNVAEYIFADDGEIDIAHQFRFLFVGGVRFEW